MTKAFLRKITYAILFLCYTYSANAQTLAAVKRGEKWFYINQSGVVVFNKLFEAAGDRFTEGLAPVKLDGKWGYLNPSGRFALKNKYTMAYNFYQGKALVWKGDNWLIINKKGKTLHKITTDILSVDTMTDGIALIKTLIGPAYLLPAGKIIYPGPNFSDFQPFSNGLARIKLDGKFGFIDTSGKLKIPAGYDAASHFNDGVACVQANRTYYLIDTEGKVLEKLPYMDEPAAFNRGLAALPMQGIYVVYKQGGSQTKTPLAYAAADATTYVYPFSEDLARFWSQRVGTGFRFGFVQMDGKLLNPYRYEWAHDFSEGLAAVKLNGQYGFIDKQGKMVITNMYDDARSFYKVK